MAMFGTKGIWSKIPTATPFDRGLADAQVAPLIEALGLPPAVEGLRTEMPSPQLDRGMFGSGDRVDKMMLIGAMLQDAGAGLRGGRGGAMAAMAKMLQDEREREQAQAARQALTERLGIGGGKPLNIQEAGPALAEAALAGLPGMGDIASIYDKATPRTQVYRGQAFDPMATRPGERLGYETENRNGWNINPVDPNQPRFNEEAPTPGARPVFDQDNRHVGWTLSDGTLQAVAGVKGAEAAAQAAGVAPYQLERVQGPNGETLTGPRSQFLGGMVAGPNPVEQAQRLAGVAAEGEYAKGKAQEALKQFTTIQQAGQNAAGTISRLQQIGGLLDGLETGRLTPAMADVASAAKTFGVTLDPNIGSKEAAQALTSKLALDLMGGSLGTGFSNADRDFVMSMVPRLGQSPDGRRQLIQVYTATEQRKQQVAAMARQWEQRAGRLDKPDRHGKTFFDYLDTWSAQNRLFK